MMKTKLRELCEDLTHRFKPLQDALSAALESYRELPAEEQVGGAFNAFGNAAESLEEHLLKMSHPQTTLIFFGPPMGGKSTLINALCGSYASRVMTFPGYPCNLRIDYGLRMETVVHYLDGRSLRFEDLSMAEDRAIQTMVQDAIVRLAEQRRKIEQEGKGFDPMVDFPEGIREIEIKLPAQMLKESGLTLVEVPGESLFSEREALLVPESLEADAGCAVFIAPSDSLFHPPTVRALEGLVSTYPYTLLIINIDSEKRDLQPDGTLQASSEVFRPEATTEAFLKHSASMRIGEAYAHGQLRIYPVDILRFACERLQGGSMEVPGDGEEDVDALGAFLRDLSELSGSSPSLQSNIAGQVNSIKTIVKAVQKTLKSKAIEKMAEDREACKESIQNAETRLCALDLVDDIAWDEKYEAIRVDIKHLLKQSADNDIAKLNVLLKEQIDNWVKNDRNLRRLELEDLDPIIEIEVERVSDMTRERLQSLLDTPTVGAALTEEEVEAIDQSGIDLKGIGHPLRETLEQDVDREPMPIVFDTAKIPVQRGFEDWVRLRGGSTVARLALGDPDAPTGAVSPEEKEKRLGESGRNALYKLVEKHSESIFLEALLTYADRVLDQFIQKSKSTVNDDAAVFRGEVQQDLEDNQIKLDRSSRTDQLLSSIQEAVDAALDSLENDLKGSVPN